MAVFKKFERSQATKYNNSLHAAYHTAQLKQLQAVAEETLETMHVSGEQLEGYVITVDDLTERSMEAQASTATGDTTALLSTWSATACCRCCIFWWLRACCRL